MYSTFQRDLNIIKNYINPFLDKYFYNKLLKKYTYYFYCDNYKRTHESDLYSDFKGVDVLINANSKNIKTIYIDEKATINYSRNKSPLKTFAFELGYFKNKSFRKGWLLDSEKKTTHYTLVWPYDNSKNNIPNIVFAEVMLISRNDIFDIINNSINNLNFSDSLFSDSSNALINNLSQFSKKTLTCSKFKNAHFTQTSNNFFELKVSDNIKFMQSLNLAEKPLNCIINKDELIKKSNEIYWIYKNNNKLKTIKKYNYFSPKTFKDAINFCQNL